MMMLMNSRRGKTSKPILGKWPYYLICVENLGQILKILTKRWRCSNPWLNKVSVIDAGSVRALSGFRDLSLTLSHLNIVLIYQKHGV